MPTRRNNLYLITGVALVCAALAAGCGDSGSAQSFPATPRTVFGGDRPVTLQVPSTYDPGHAVPLLLILHGYGATGMIQEQYMGLGALVESEGILIAAPDGTVDRVGRRFWNATPACCDLFHTGVDDVGYLRGLIADIRQDYNVDPKRIFLIGHSNGGFMVHRMACDAADDIAAIASLAGATFENPADCKPATEVSVLEIHGDADSLIFYAGGTITAPYPGAVETVSHWQGYDHCAPGLVSAGMNLDLDGSLPGNETMLQGFAGCARGSDVQLWTIHGGGHVPALTSSFAPTVWQFLSEHPKP
jgi:polyhydroxybutyrate depolymerase